MFERISNSYALVKQSWAILRKDKGIMVFPVLSGICSLVIGASFIVPFAMLIMHGEKSHHNIEPYWYALLFAFYLVTFFITIFFNVAIMHCAAIRMDGGAPTVSEGFRGAFSRFGSIFAWALTSATVGVVLKIIEQRAGIVGKIVSGIFGLAWTLLTYFVVPVMIFEGAGVGKSIERSTELFKKTWGEQVVGQAGLGLFFGLLAMLGIIPIVLGVMVMTQGAAGIGLGIALIGSAIAYWIILAVISSALQGIYNVALYRFASTGAVVAGYDENLIARRWVPKN